VQRASALSLLRARFRPWVRGGEASIEVPEGRCAFIEAPFISKLIAPALAGLKFDMGNHRVFGITAPERRAMDIEILHLPLRARTILAQRIEDFEPRIAPMRNTDVFGWQSLYFKRCQERGTLEREWRANSQRHSALDIDGRSVPLIPDDRLRTCVLKALPFLVAARLAPDRFTDSRIWLIRSCSRPVENSRMACYLPGRCAISAPPPLKAGHAEEPDPRRQQAESGSR
jgi:hypothetical protein